MATVTGATADRVQALEDAGIKSAGIDANGHLILTRNDDSTIDAGSFQAPTGAVNMFGGGTVPAGWLLCNGTAISRTTYAALFAVIGTTYGAGDGATTFNLPNMEARLPRMQAAARGGTGGAATHTHTLPTHTHAAHQHGLSGGSPTGFAKIYVAPGTAPNLFMDRITGVASAWNADAHSDVNTVLSTVNTHTQGARLQGNTGDGGGSTVNTGGSPSDPTSSLPPYLNLNFIIKA